MIDDRPSVPPPPSPQRVAAFIGVAMACLAAAGGYVWWASRERAAITAGYARSEAPLVALPGAPFLLLRDASPGLSRGKLALEVPGTGSGPRLVSNLNCERLHAASGRGICLEAQRAAVTTYRAHLFDSGLVTTASFDLAGPPSRARMSPDGTRAATTVFVSGHNYASPGFSTRTSIIDVTSGRLLVPDLEAFEVEKDGQPFKSSNFNFWGVTFTPDTAGFYATLGTGGRVLLVRGDIAQRKMIVVAHNVECPSLSPDATRVAFKRRVDTPRPGRVVWQIVVRELTSGKETALAHETRSVDDQVEWLDEREIAYALPDDKTPGGSDVWAILADGSAAPRLLLPMASSPAMVRR